MAKDESHGALILDANVLIDYCDSDVSILGLASEQRRMYVAGPVLDEAKELDEDECGRIGLRILQPSTEQLLEAGRGSSALSFRWIWFGLNGCPPPMRSPSQSVCMSESPPR